MIICMNRLYLSASEKQKLEDLHRHSKDVRESQRIGAILLKSEGWSIPRLNKHLENTK